MKLYCNFPGRNSIDFHWMQWIRGEFPCQLLGQISLARQAALPLCQVVANEMVLVVVMAVETLATGRAGNVVAPLTLPAVSGHGRCMLVTSPTVATREGQQCISAVDGEAEGVQGLACNNAPFIFHAVTSWSLAWILGSAQHRHSFLQLWCRNNLFRVCHLHLSTFPHGSANLLVKDDY